MKLTARARLREERARAKDLAFEVGQLTAENQLLRSQLQQARDEKADWFNRAERFADDNLRTVRTLSQLQFSTVQLLRFVARSQPAEQPAARAA